MSYMMVLPQGRSSSTQLWPMHGTMKGRQVTLIELNKVTPAEQEVLWARSCARSLPQSRRSLELAHRHHGIKQQLVNRLKFCH